MLPRLDGNVRLNVHKPRNKHALFSTNNTFSCQLQAVTKAKLSTQNAKKGTLPRSPANLSSNWITQVFHLRPRFRDRFIMSQIPKFAYWNSDSALFQCQLCPAEMYASTRCLAPILLERRPKMLVPAGLSQEPRTRLSKGV